MKPKLSKREEQVLELAVKGKTDDMIAQSLGIERGTVNSYWVRIRGKHGHLSRTHLVANYVRAQGDAHFEEQALANTTSSATQEQSNQDSLGAERARHEGEMGAERARHEQELDDQAQANADDLKDQKELMAKAQAEIDRLRDLLKLRKK